jgi:hypothetical protein
MKLLCKSIQQGRGVAPLAGTLAQASHYLHLAKKEQSMPFFAATQPKGTKVKLFLYKNHL